MMRRFLSIAWILCVFVPAAAAGATRDDNWRLCSEGDADVRLAACSSIIQSGLEDKQNLSIAFYNRALASAEKRDLDRAVRDFGDAIRLNPNFVEAFNGRGNVYYDAGDLDHAIQDYGEAIRLKPNFAGAYYNRGSAYADKGDLDRALGDYDQALKLDPGFVDALVSRGIAYVERGAFDRAIEDYDRAIKLDPEFVRAFNNRGNAYSGKGDFERAIRDYDEAIRLAPNYAEAFYNRGNANFAKGDYHGSARDFGQAFKLVPTDVTALHSRGFANFMAGKVGDAESDFKQLVDLRGDAYAYGVLWLHVARARLAHSDSEELANNASVLDLTRWPGPMIAYFLGQGGVDALNAKAAMGDDETKTRQRCEAMFLLAEDALTRHKTDSAEASFRSAREICPAGFLEYSAAASELQRMGKL